MGKQRPSKNDMPEKVSARMAPEPEPHHGHSVMRMLVTSVLLLAIAYVAVYLAVGTDGFRSYAAEYLGDRLGMPVRIRDSKATLSLDIVLSGIMLRATDEVSRAELLVGEASVQWGFPGLGGKGRSWLENMALKDCSLTMVQREDGGWDPAFAGRLGDWLSRQCGLKIPKAAAVPAVEPLHEGSKDPVTGPRVDVDPTHWRGGIFSLSDGKITWLNSSGAELAVVEGVSLGITPIRVPHRSLVHYRASIARGRFEDKRQVYDLVYESLRTGGDEIVLAFTGQWATEPPKGDVGGDE